MELFQIGKGACQCCILPQCLFNLYVNYAKSQDEAQAEIKMLGKILITSDKQRTPRLWKKVKKN